MTMAVRPVRRRSRASRIIISVLVSTLEVASSRIKKSRIVRQGAGETHELALADGKSRAALGDQSVQALRQANRESARVRLRAAQIQRPGAVYACGAQADVRFERAGKEKRVLQHDSELAAEILDVELADIGAVEQNLAALDIVEAEQELNRSGFAGAGVADDGDGLAGRTRKETSRRIQSSSLGFAPP